MATRKNTPGRTSGKGKKGKTKAELKRLLKKAQAEVEKLLAAHESGTLKRGNLKSRLTEVRRVLTGIEPFEEGW